MLTVLSVLGKLFVSGFLFFLFGYFETLATTGVIVSISIASYLTLFKSSKGFSSALSIVLLVSEIVGRVCEFKLVCFCSFLALNILLLRELLISNESNDLLVKMKPCEKEIRAILFEKDPAVLHRVDFWLDKHKGHERELLEKVKQKYLRESETESEEESGSDSEEEQPRLQGRQATAVPAPSPPVSQLRTPASIRPQANPNFYYTPQQKEVLALIQQYDPNLLPGSHRLLADYRGRENELLHQLRTEYGLVLDPPVSSSSSSRAGPAQAAYRYNQHHGGGVQLPNSYTTSDGVRDYYGSGSTAPQFGKTSPLSGPFSSPPSSSSPYYATGNGRSSGDVHNRGRIYN